MVIPSLQKSPCAVEDQNPKSDKAERAYLDTVVSEAYPSVSQFPFLLELVLIEFLSLVARRVLTNTLNLIFLN